MEESLIIRAWPYVSLGELEGKDLISYWCRVLSLISKGIVKINAADS